MRRQRAGRRARRCLAWALSSWLVVSVALLLHVQVLRQDLIAPDFAVRLAKVRQRQAEQPGRPLWLVLGSSRMRTGYWPESVEPPRDRQGRPVLVFNFAHNGMGPVFQHLYLRRLLREGVRPDLVVLEVMPLYLHHEPDAFLTHFLVWPELPRAASYIPWHALVRNLARRQVELYPDAARAVFPSDLHWLVPPGDALRVGPTLALGGPGQMRDRVTEADRRRRIDLQCAMYQWRDVTVSERGERALRDSLELCRLARIEVVLLLSPEGESFGLFYPPGAEGTLVARVRRLGAEAGVRVVDARRWLVEEEFCDGHHMLRRGAAKFTRRLHHEVLAPLARGEHHDHTSCPGEPSNTAPQQSPAPTAAHNAGSLGGR
jgi:hypothetical protein